MRQISRNIYFFKVEIKKFLNNTFLSVKNPQDVCRKIYDDINALPYNINFEAPTKYLKTYDDNVLYLEIDTKDIMNSKIINGQFGISRRNALPLIEDKGNFTELIIPPTAGVAEITHFVHFVEDNLMGIEFNFYGPRFSRLSFYIQEKTSLISQFDLIPILKMDISDTLNKLNEVSVFRFQAHRSASETIKKLNENLYEAFKAAAAATSEADTIEILLRKKDYSKIRFPLPLKIKNLIEILKDKDQRDQFKRLGATAYDSQLKRERYFDFLEDKFVFTKKVIPLNERSRSVNSASMYSAIKEAYEEHRKELILEIGGV